jgi:putative ABC transport system permease protein
VVIGIGLALALTRSLRSLVFGVGVADPATFLVVTAALLLVAAVATLVPAVRATRTSPLEAIRLD